MVNDRIQCEKYLSKVMTADQAAQFIKPGMTVGMSGFTPAGHAKAVPLAIARRAERGERLNLTVLAGASVGDEIDGAMLRAGAIAKRMAYQTHPDMRRAINEGRVEFTDMHLSQLPAWIRQGILPVDVAIVEIVGIDPEGRLIPSTSVGIANTVIDCAKQVILEVNTTQPMSLKGIHDIYSPKNPPNTQPIGLVHAQDRIGTWYYPCDFDKICAIVLTGIPDDGLEVAGPDPVSQAIADNLVGFIKQEVAAGRIDLPLPPIQSGVGSVANAVLAGLKSSGFDELVMYSEVIQDAVFDLIDAGKLRFASGTALALSPGAARRVLGDFERYREKIMLRPQEISNHPEIIRRLGLIAINTVIEADIYGNTNSSHVGGARLMNAIGGSGDFAQNAYLSVFITQSTAKGGTLSCIVPFVTHVDHTEHDIHVLVTEQGAADLRGLAPRQRARKIINTCAHPDFRDALNDYLDRAIANSPFQQTPHLLEEVFNRK